MKLFLVIFFSLLLQVSFGQQQQQVVTRQQAFSFAVTTLDTCDRAIWSCCQTDRPTFELPVTCFESNGCFGLHWMGEAACAPSTLNAIGAQIKLKMLEYINGNGAAAAAAAAVAAQQPQSKFGFGFAA